MEADEDFLGNACLPASLGMGCLCRYTHTQPSNNGDFIFFPNLSSVVSDLPADASLSAQLLPQWLRASECRWVAGLLISLSS